MEAKAAVESTGNTRYFKSRLEAAGIGVTVINTLKMKVVKGSLQSKKRAQASA
jgi:transposase